MTTNLLPGDDEESLRFENEMLKMKLIAEKGALSIGNFPSDKVPPEVENKFLKIFESMEDYFSSQSGHKEVLVYEFIGRPDFIDEKELNDEQLSVELNRLESLLADKQIAFSVLSNIDDRLIYKFVTEDLFNAETLDIPFPEMTTHFIYEEFHPINEYDTRRQCEEFIRIFFGKDFDTLIQENPVEQIRNFVELYNFRKAFEEFTNVTFEVLNAEVISEKCTRKATISFEGKTSVSSKPIPYSGEATFMLEYKDDFWFVVLAHFPGMTAASFETI